MDNPALALTETSMNLVKVGKKLERTWEAFILNGKLTDKVLRPVVRDSWERSSRYGISPRLFKAQSVLSEEELYHIKIQSEFIDISRSFMKTITESISGTGHIAVLCDAKGRILELIGDDEVKYRAALNNFVVGTDWSEEGVGTNAIGTAIKLQGPVQILSAEHYCQGWHAWTCSAAPIIDPISKTILGVLDLTGYWTHYHPHTLGLVMAQISAIERELYQCDLIRQQRLTNRYLELVNRRSVDGILAVDIRGRVTQLNDMAAKQLGMEPGQVIGRTLEDFPQLRNAILATIQYGEQNHERESLLVEDRLEKEFRFIGKPVVEGGKSLGALITLAVDTPERKTKDWLREPQKVKSNANGNSARYVFSDLLGKSEEFITSVDLAKLAVLNDANVLLQGESGTGKELFAQAIHLASKRAAGSFVAINCGAFPKELVGSELFGYAAGAFTGASKNGSPGKFEMANKGTIFLDEIGEMPLEQQVNLLRVLQEKEIVRIGGRQTIPINVRVIAATNRNLADEVKKGNFRADLFYRLNVISVHIPPLRERKEDIALMAEFFLEQARREYDRPRVKLNQEVLEILEAYPWPGNVRELRNAVEMSVNLARGEFITPDCLPPEIYKITKRKESILDSLNILPETVRNCSDLTVVKQIERDLILKIIEEYSGNMTKAAARLNMDRSTLYRKLKK